MPITGVLDLQRRSLPLGEIRIGESEPIPGKKGRKPLRRETFRFTTPDEGTAHAIAERLGGEPQPWDRRRGYWVVDTSVAKLDVWVPPRGLAVDAWMELWVEGKCRRRCDGITEQRSGEPCMCPQPGNRDDPAQVARAAAERKRLAALRQACNPLTRINLAIPWLPGAIGVWRLNTGSANAAVETADTGLVLERARALDVFLPALLLIHWRPGQDGHPYPVPVLRPRPSAEQIAELPAGMDGMLAMLSAGSGRLALTAGAAKPEPRKPEPPAGPVQPEDAADEGPAERIAKLIPLTGSRDDVAKLIERAKAEQVLDREVWYAAEEGDAETGETIRDLLDNRWWELPGPPKPAERERQAPAAPAPPASGDGSLFDDDDPAWGAA